VEVVDDVVEVVAAEALHGEHVAGRSSRATPAYTPAIVPAASISSTATVVGSWLP
jgi:hypothetical protein